jgi:type IV pilus assembly protein PilW
MRMNVSRSYHQFSRPTGFSLVELMVAMVLGLIVIGAVIALVLSMMNANNQTMRATRLSQEMRAVAALMANDIRRAGGVRDPFTEATANNGRPRNLFAGVDTTTAGCLRYAYDAANGSGFHVIALRSNAIWLGTATDNTGNGCNAATQRLSSPQVQVSALQFAQTGNRIDITIQGQLASDAQIRRRYTESVYIRSAAGT